MSGSQPIQEPTGPVSCWSRQENECDRTQTREICEKWLRRRQDAVEVRAS
jgi:hypothetical protein